MNYGWELIQLFDASYMYAFDIEYKIKGELDRGMRLVYLHSKLVILSSDLVFAFIYTGKVTYMYLVGTVSLKSV